MSSEQSPPVFPLELEREILETAAERYPETIPNLVLVAQRVQEWIERIKYRTVCGVGHSPCSLAVLQQAIRSGLKTADFFAARVRHLFLGLDAGRDVLRDVLPICTGIQSLVLFPFPEGSPLPSLQALKPRRIAFLPSRLFGDPTSFDPLHPVFTFITHLDLFEEFKDGFPSALLAKLARLPALTHLALFKFTEIIVPTELLTNMKLEVLIRMQIEGPYPDIYDDLPFFDDPRLVFILLSDDDYEGDWLAGVSGGLDFWAGAELFIAKKRRGEIKPSSRCWIEAGDGI